MRDESPQTIHNALSLKVLKAMRDKPIRSFYAVINAGKTVAKD
jgi:hypothetical protein